MEINSFSEKILIWAKWVVLGPKMMRPRNSGSTVRINLRFCSRKGAKRHIKLILMVFLEKLSLGAIGPLWSENGTLYSSG